MKSENLKILTNIIGAVESGGQVYGKRNYSAYAGKGANSANEKTCTLGWAQNYGNEGRKLCRMILATDPEAFRKADTASIEARLSEDWEARAWSPSAKEKAALIAIITTDAGKKCQDELFEQLMTAYEKQANDNGVTEVPAVMMWCEIEHLGGLGPVKRIFKRAKSHDVDAIFASLLQDQADKSSSTQVGDAMYQRRHECCVKWIKQYVKNEGGNKTMAKTRAAVVALAQSWLGKKESDGSYKEIIDIYNGYKGTLPRNTKMSYGWAWCACTWSALAVKLGYTDIMPIEISCGNLVAKAKEMGIWAEDDAYVPDPGDAILYDWDDNGVGDCTGWPDHIGTVETVNRSTGVMTIIEGNFNDAVQRRTIKVNARYIRGYICPKYDAAGTSSGSSSESQKPAASSGGGICKTPQWVGKVTATSLNVRSWAGTENPNIKSWPYLYKGNLVDVCDSVKAKDGSVWYYIRIDGRIYGFVHSAYIAKA